jgi:acyl carrier protein
VFHAAQPRDAAPAGISELDEARLRSELDALAGDAALLDELTAGKPLTAFVVATSIMGIWGAGGFGAHAAGHAAAEAIVQRRRAAGRPAASVAWGPVPDGDAEFTAMVRRHGVPELTDDDVTAVLDRAVDDPGEDVIAARIDWRRFATAYTAGRPSPLLTEIEEARVEEAPVEEGPVEGPADLPGLVRREVAAVLGYEDASAVPPDKAFKDLGFDSVRAVELRNRIRAATGLELSAALVFDYPSPAAVASHLAELTGGAGNRPLAGGPAEHLDLVSAAVSGMDAGERERTAVRLRRLLTELETAGDNGIDRTATDLTGASADEVLAFIDREFGASGDPAREG